MPVPLTCPFGPISKKTRPRHFCSRQEKSWMAPRSEITNPGFSCRFCVLGPGSWVLWPRVWLRTALAFRSDLGRRRRPCSGAGLHTAQLNACGGRRADLREAVREPQREVEVAARGTCHSTRKCPTVCGPGREPRHQGAAAWPLGAGVWVRLVHLLGCLVFPAMWQGSAACGEKPQRGTCSRYLGLV